jgi:DNA polymerase III subunit epsilon
MRVTVAAETLCGFDIESTGVDPSVDRIVMASLVTVKSGHPLAVRNWLVDPGVEIPAEATEVHGITTEHAKMSGRHPGEALSEIADCLTGATANGWPIVVFNAPFDLTMLHYELIRHCGTGRTIAYSSIIDPLVLDKRADRYRRGSRKLIDTCGHYGVRLVAAHSSEADALAAVQVFDAIVERYPEIGGMNLDELQTAQAKWYRESQFSFADYLRGKVAQQILVEAIRMPSERAEKLAELSSTLSRADSVAANADGWPFYGCVRS